MSISTEQFPVMESFYTIQGEGAYTGQAAYFVRIAGCDVGCVWCDVKESWDADKHPKFSIQQIVDECSVNAGKIVVITGGEPLMYNLEPLTTALKNAGLRTHIETSGSYPISGNWDWVCFSPKKFLAPVEGFGLHANELKVIVYNKSDFEFAEKQAQTVGENCKLFLQPEWSKASVILPEIIAYVKANPKWQISLQTHKFMNIP